jgi:hypothetical protein
VKPGDTVMGGQSREREPVLVDDTSKRGEDTETSETPVSGLSNVKLFREWVMTAVAPPSMPEEMLARIVFYEPDDLPKMIEIVDEAERFIRVASADFIRRTTSGKLQGMTSRGRERMCVIVREEVGGRSDNRIEWLDKMRLYLKEEREDYESEQRRCAALRFRDRHPPLEVPTRTSGVQESLNEKQGQRELISLASSEQDAHDHVSRAVSETIACINSRKPKKWRDLADRVGSLLLTIFLCTMAVGSVCGFLLLWIKVLLTT